MKQQDKETSLADDIARIIGTYNEEVVSPFFYKAVDVGRGLANIPLRASGFDELEEPTEEDIENRGKITRQVSESIAGALFLDPEEVYDEEGEVREAETYAGMAGQFGAERCEFGDASIQLYMLPRVPLTIVIWAKDEQFRARASILFDQTAASHLPLDALGAAVNLAVDALVKAGTESN